MNFLNALFLSFTLLIVSGRFNEEKVLVGVFSQPIFPTKENCKAVEFQSEEYASYFAQIAFIPEGNAFASKISIVIEICGTQEPQFIFKSLGTSEINLAKIFHAHSQGKVTI